MHRLFTNTAEDLWQKLAVQTRRPTHSGYAIHKRQAESQAQRLCLVVIRKVALRL